MHLDRPWLGSEVYEVFHTALNTVHMSSFTHYLKVFLFLPLHLTPATDHIYRLVCRRTNGLAALPTVGQVTLTVAS